MSMNIKLKKGTGKPVSLKEGEPAIDKTTGELYVGLQDGNVKKVIADVDYIKEGTGTNSIIFNDLENNIAKGQQSHAQGNSTLALGAASHSEGYKTQTGMTAFSIDKTNSSQTDKKYKLSSVTGIEENDVISIITNTELYKDCATVVSIDVTNKTITVDTYQNFNETQGYVFIIEKPMVGNLNITANASHAEGHTTFSLGQNSHSEGWSTFAIGGNSHSEGEMAVAFGNISHAEGDQTIARGITSHAEGGTTQALGDYSHAEGGLTEARGAYSHAEGNGTIASGAASHAEGGGNATASGLFSHAEGQITIASGSAAHAEGSETEASGVMSHSEGCQTKAIGDCSHSEGYGTITKGFCQNARGKYNIENSGNYIEIVGNGQSDEKRSNAYTLDWNGSAWFAGGITLGTEKNKVITEKELNNYKYEFTEEDKTLIVNAVIAALPNGDEVSY